MSLLEAITNGQIEIVKELLSEGGDVNQRDENGNTPLIIAARHKQTAIARLLIEHQADIHAKNNKEQTVWGWAVSTGNIELVELLIQRGIDVNIRLEYPGWEGFTALMLAAYKGNAQLVRFLIEHGAEIERKMHYGWTALMLAALEGHFDIVAFLLDQGADIHAKDPDNQTALIAAARGGHHEIVEYLIETGSPVNSQYQDWTALMWAVKKGSLETVKSLIKKGADINATVEEGAWKGFTALMLAVHEAHTDIVRFLVEHGADVNARDEEGTSVLMWATMRGYLDIVEILTAQGNLALNAKDQDGQTAAMYAHRYWQREILHILVEKGAEHPFPRKSRWLRRGKILLRILMIPYLLPKTLYGFKKNPILPKPFSPDQSELKESKHSGIMKLLWSCEISEATCMTYGNWRDEETPKILVANKQKQLHILDIEGNIESTLKLPARFRYIECGCHQEQGARLLGISKNFSRVYVIDHHGKTLWRSLKWMGLEDAHWGDLNGDGNDEIVLSVFWLRKLIALTGEGKILWKVPKTFSFFNQPTNHIIVPHNHSQQALVLATDIGGVKVYDHTGKVLRILQPGGSYGPLSIAASVINSSRTLQIVAIDNQFQDHELVYEIFAFDLAGKIMWKTPIHEDSLSKSNFACGDINADGIWEWVFIEGPGELIVVSPQGEKLATLSDQEGVEEFTIVPEPDGHGILVTLQAGILKGYEYCE